jgi:hypothetical protein
MSAPNPELRRFVDRLLDGGTLGHVEMERLEGLLGTPEGLDYYLATTSNEAMLPEALAHIRRDAKRTAPPRWKSVLSWTGIAAAACLMFVAGWGFHTLHDRPTPIVSTTISEKPARITGMVGVEWDTTAPDLLSTQAATRRLAIRSGLVELTYDSGVRVTLEGPADFTVKDAGAGQLTHGKLAATVPKGAEGFRVDYATGSVVDLGTEFVMDAKTDGSTELGVFVGKVELHLPGDAPRPILANQALIHQESADERLQAIPLDREKFIRQLPSRDFRWEITSPGKREVSFDVSHLIWKGSDYRAVVKSIKGTAPVQVSHLRLALDGQTVAEDSHEGIIGRRTGITANNLFRLNLPQSAFRDGRWTLHATLTPTAGKNPSELGIVQLEEGMVTSATADDFIGRWTFHKLGIKMVREFHADGRITHEENDKLAKGVFLGSRWTLEDGILRARVTGTKRVEEFILRDRKTLIFVSETYDDNAVKTAPESESLH